MGKVIRVLGATGLALVTIDATVPEDFAVAPRKSPWERSLSVSGWVRWMTAVNPAITAPDAPLGVSPEDLPVLAFLSQQLINANPAWHPAHKRQLEPLDRSRLVVLPGGH